MMKVQYFSKVPCEFHFQRSLLACYIFTNILSSCVGCNETTVGPKTRFTGALD